MKLPHSLVGCVVLFSLPALGADEVPYGVGQWPENLGNHRARIRVAEKADAVWVHLPWRRRDANPERKDVIVIDAATNRPVANVLRVRIERESGDLLFQPATVPGEYHVYYLPNKNTGSSPFPVIAYSPPSNTADAAWAKSCEGMASRIKRQDTLGIPAAKVLEFQAINDFHRFDPMEIVATAAETQRLLAAQAGKPYLLFPEDRRNPIRMTSELPLRWIQSGPTDCFEGEACRGEFYAFQVGVYAAGQRLANLRIRFTPLACEKHSIPAAAIRCFNMGGTDWLGRPLVKTVNIAKGRIQPLWIGVQVPPDAPPGVYQGSIELAAEGLPDTAVKVSLRVNEKQLVDAGDSEPWRHSRLRWLDSTIGLDDEAPASYPPIAVDGQTVSVLGRRARLADSGLLESIQSTFGYSVDRIDASPREILAGPMKFVVDTPTGSVSWRHARPKIVSQASGAVTWETAGTADGMDVHCQAKMEADGYVNFRLTLHARQVAQLEDVRLEIPLRSEVARYMMGLGSKGGTRPARWDWKWDARRPNNQWWIGDVNAGLHCKLKHVEDRWDLSGLQETGPYRDWSNAGHGGCRVQEEGDRVVVREYTGPRRVAAGDKLYFNFGLLITPLKILNKDHWQWRYYQVYRDPTVAEAADAGATILNLHQSRGKANPHINYPFLTADLLTNYAKQAHDRGMKFKIYYTLRELSTYVTELWALRSLDREVFTEGPNFDLPDPLKAPKLATYANSTGSAWLLEHLVTNFQPAWHEPLGGGHWDAAVHTMGLSRWHNYYLEGLAWLVKNVGIDGLYLDGIGYDREIMKRVRKVLDRSRRGCLIDFHSGNPGYSAACFYLEHFPYIDSLWFGEGFNYDETPDYWLLEMSGIPFGLFGEMLQGGGNPWRGMVYGMTNRLGWGGHPGPIWKLWDDFGIRDARMIGYWDPACPVKTERPDVRATAYVKAGKTLVSLASWASEPVDCRLAIDWAALGLDPQKAHLFAPPIERFQPTALWDPTDTIPVQPARGWLLVIDHEKHAVPKANTVDVTKGRALLLDERFSGTTLGKEWKTSLSDKPRTSLKLEKGAMRIDAPANCFAFAERPLPSGSRIVQCSVFPNTDKGATWGPGLTVLWARGALRANVRAEGRLGVDDGSHFTFDGSVIPLGVLHLRIRVEEKEILVEGSCDGRGWQRLQTFPRDRFRGDPIAVRLGKSGPGGRAEDHSSPGPAGTCQLKSLRVFGPPASLR